MMDELNPMVIPRRRAFLIMFFEIKDVFTVDGKKMPIGN